MFAFRRIIRVYLFYTTAIMSNCQEAIPVHLHELINDICKELCEEDEAKIEVEVPVSSGKAWLSNIVGINLNYHKDNLPVTRRMIVKLAVIQNVYREVFRIHEVFEREIYVYTTLLPEMVKIQEETQVKNVFAPFTQCIRTLSYTGKETVILQNMTSLGYKSLNTQQPLDYQHAALIMEHLGKFHALSFALRKKKPKLFEQLAANTSDSFFAENRNYVKIVQNLGIQILNHIDQKSVVFEKFRNFVQDPSFVTDELIKAESIEGYTVFNHGDPQTKNLLFKYSNELIPSTPTDLCLLDWQLCRLASPSLDIAFLVWTCTDKKFRDLHYEKLLKVYFDSFSSFLQELGHNPDECFPLEVFKDHLKKFSVFGMFVALVVVSTQFIRPENAPDFSTVTNISEFIDKFSIIHCSQYIDRIKDILTDFIRYDYDF